MIHGAHDAALTYTCATGRANSDAMSQQSIQDGLFIDESKVSALEGDVRHGVVGVAYRFNTSLRVLSAMAAASAMSSGGTLSSCKVAPRFSITASK